MDIKEIIADIEDCFNYGDFDGIEKDIDMLLKQHSKDEVSKKLSEMILKNYTIHKSDFLAKVMEVIIRKSPDLAMIKHPENYLFKTSVITGSNDLYECYIEEAAEPALANSKPQKKEHFYMELYNIAQNITELFYNDYKQYRKGTHYNGAFKDYEKNENIVLLAKEDYQVMNDLAEKYNAMVGRKDIVNDLSKRAGLDPEAYE